jgi:transglutaminase-like putative cysteine protease
MRNRWKTTIIGVVILAAALGGLFGVSTNVAHTRPTAVPSNSSASPSVTPTNSGANHGGFQFPFNISLNRDLLPAIQSLNLAPLDGLPPHIPLFNVQGASGTSLLRNTVTEFYDGNIWKFVPDPSLISYTGQPLDEEVSGYHNQAIEEMTIAPLAEYPTTETSLPVSQYVTALSAPGAIEYLPEDGIFMAPNGFPETYSFRSVSYQFDESTLKYAQTDTRPEYLQLPESITDRSWQLAQDIIKNQTGPYDRAKAIEQYLQNNYLYDYDYRQAPAGHEPNDWFLFDEKKGVCVNFNSAFVTLARAAGIPARMVGGYAISPQEDNQTVCADQAHAWSEVKFQDLGWITFDATGTIPALLATKTQITAVTSVVLKDQICDISGTVNSGDIEVNGVQVEYYVNPIKSQTGGTLIGRAIVSGGVFQSAINLPPEVDVGSYQLMAHALASARFSESWSDPEIKVMAKTHINLEIAAQIRLAEPLQMTGVLSDSSNKPLADQLINIILDGQEVTQVITDTKGEFTWQQSFSTTGSHVISADFAGTDYYLSANQQTQIQIIPATIPGWQVALIALAVMGTAVGGFWLYRRRAQKPSVKLPSLSDKLTPVVELNENISPSANLRVEFPQINPPFPDVWGQNEELTVQCNLQSAAGMPLVEKKIEIFMGKLIATLITGTDGSARVILTITRKGQYNLTAQYAMENTGELIADTRIMRIVDYREEVVDLYRRWLDDLRLRGIDPAQEATPREVERQLLAVRPEVPKAALNKSICCFEEADYSLHPVTRLNYEVMYLADDELRKYASQSE